MPKFYCDYCDVYLTHDSTSVRRAHNHGRAHIQNVIDYYLKISQEQLQSKIDSITSAHDLSKTPIQLYNFGQAPKPGKPLPLSPFTIPPGPGLVPFGFPTPRLGSAIPPPPYPGQAQATSQMPVVGGMPMPGVIPQAGF
ncbi:U1 small nuclear ribonucleoprotein C [Neolecta irregularis DAH-3]|uniref:U1 small nuclear ribonucleoprotein C n=1 Tax=Neolecta irregularis (strain DAH-3) TaxID=1198029 RepID=A0A1U7LNK3_NEOID|nr:U1 small nuclear ribonucleoprotein C [Neolecta irregularis DAH-3]|eukprot:OLL24250.1 U1 small nuclear ribonucleoprotein C [Neolecta irregularis DAH-3]